MTGGLSAAGPRCEINVTPLIDVLLVLLIVFMIITPLMPRGLPADVAQSGMARTDEETPVVLRIMGDHTLRLNRREIDWGTVKSVIGQVFSQRASKTLFVEADAQVEYREVPN